MAHPTELQIVTGQDGKAKWQPVEVVVKKLGETRQSESGGFQKVWILNPDFETVTEAAYWAKNRQLTEQDLDVPMQMECRVTVRNGRRDYLLADPFKPAGKSGYSGKPATAAGKPAYSAKPAASGYGKDDFYVRVASMGLAYAKDLCKDQIALDDINAVGFQFAGKILEIAKELKQAYPDWQ